MAYCRWGESDVYIYDDVTYGLYCCLCDLVDQRTRLAGFVAGKDYKAMLDHVAEHRRRGDYIPEYVDSRLEEDFASQQQTQETADGQ